MKISRKLIILCILLSVIPALLIGAIAYNSIQSTVKQGIQERLMDESKDWRIITELNYNNIKNDSNNTKLQDEKIEEMKNLISNQKIGKTGYIWVVDENGVYIVSKERLRDGESIIDTKDTNGAFFIQEAIIKAKASGEGAGIQEYYWLNNGEKNPRMKVAGITYVKELGWTIGVSAYYDDFDIGQKVLKQITLIILIVIIISTIIAYFFAIQLSKPIKQLTEAGNKIAEGDIGVKIPEIKTKDEIQDLSMTITLMAGALKFLKEKNKAKKIEIEDKK